MILGTWVPTGILLPESLLQAGWVQVLATFVALNTLMYATLALVKMLPTVDPPAFFGRRNRRMQNRGIHPGPPNAQPRARTTRGSRRRVPSSTGTPSSAHDGSRRRRSARLAGRT